MLSSRSPVLENASKVSADAVSASLVPGPGLKLIGVSVPRHPADWHRTMSTVSTEVTGNSFMQPAWICSAIREHSALPDL